jgi:hypothetical protein
VDSTSLNTVSVNVVDTRTTGSTFIVNTLPSDQPGPLNTYGYPFSLTVSPVMISPGMRDTLLRMSWVLLPYPGSPSAISFPFSLLSYQPYFTLTITGTAGASPLPSSCTPNCNVPMTVAVTTTCTSPNPRSPSQTACPDVKFSTTGPVIVGQTATFTLHIDPPPAKKKEWR